MKYIRALWAKHRVSRVTAGGTCNYDSTLKG